MPCAQMGESEPSPHTSVPAQLVPKEDVRNNAGRGNPPEASRRDSAEEGTICVPRAGTNPRSQKTGWSYARRIAR